MCTYTVCLPYGWLAGVLTKKRRSESDSDGAKEETEAGLGLKWFTKEAKANERTNDRQQASLLFIESDF